MGEGNRKIACHHIELQDGCPWCGIYQHQTVRQCDRCKNEVDVDLVYLSLKTAQPQLLCIYCHHDELMWG